MLRRAQRREGCSIVCATATLRSHRACPGERQRCPHGACTLALDAELLNSAAALTIAFTVVVETQHRRALLRRDFARIVAAATTCGAARLGRAATAALAPSIPPTKHLSPLSKRSKTPLHCRGARFALPSHPVMRRAGGGSAYAYQRFGGVCTLTPASRTPSSSAATLIGTRRRTWPSTCRCAWLGPYSTVSGPLGPTASRSRSPSRAPIRLAACLSAVLSHASRSGRSIDVAAATTRPSPRVATCART
mmetsp:Transcript_4440/g.17823  ORF Transcript_4440/g.17823 Transcript_4440/m.17823 type:complete len:249 (+) Transcript_4440:2108-2854(+)